MMISNSQPYLPPCLSSDFSSICLPPTRLTGNPQTPLVSQDSYPYIDFCHIPAHLCLALHQLHPDLQIDRHTSTSVRPKYAHSLKCHTRPTTTARNQGSSQAPVPKTIICQETSKNNPIRLFPAKIALFLKA
jgi:hypothetical protein